ncbi:hypothetical protein EIP86_002951 [Pleurotus ostreatoroseus]|nr:hypothetical protein EIP86_002951 [Pleurotus ostreatoroseus]
MSFRYAHPLSAVTYFALVLITAFFVGVSCALLLSQAVRNAPNRSWNKNFNAAVIGAAYAFVSDLSQPAYRSAQKAAAHLKVIQDSWADGPAKVFNHEQPVWKHIQQEYARVCLIAYESQPKNGSQEGWGAPG